MSGIGKIFFFAADEIAKKHQLDSFLPENKSMLPEKSAAKL
jgi:hypothetical protein